MPSRIPKSRDFVLSRTNEAELKGKLVEKLKEQLTGAVIFPIQDRWTSGIPDIAVTWMGRTTWWECKYADPDLDSKGIQDLTLLRLAGAGYARYVIYEDRGSVRRTRIVHPKDINEWMATDVVVSGFNHEFVADYIRKVHSL